MKRRLAMSLNDGSIYQGQGLIMKASLTIRSDDPLIDMVSRATKLGERASSGIRRCLVRHMQIIGSTQPPNAEMVSRLHTIAASAPHILHSIGYTEKSVITKAILESTIQGDRRMELLSYIERITYAEYALLLEAVESMRG
jgi:hypothetical protein